MSGASNVKKIIGEIVQECCFRGHAVSDTLVAFMVKAVVLDPSNGFIVDQALTEQDIQKLQVLCQAKLMEECSPSLDTIKMQFPCVCPGEFFEAIQQVAESRLSPVRKQITNSKGTTWEGLSALYSLMVSYTLLRSGIGSLADPSTVQEARDALQSFFSWTDLGAFMGLSKTDKERQLIELSMIVTGIQLFNKASEDTDLHQLIPALLNETLPVSPKSVEDELNESQSLAWKYTAVLEGLLQPDNQTSGGNVPIILLKQALYNVRQHEAFLRVLLADVCLCAKQTDILHTELLSIMKLLKNTMKAKTAVCTAHVFVSVLSLLFYIVLLSLLSCSSTFFTELECSFQCCSFLPLYFSDEQIVPAEMKTQEWLLPETTANFTELPLQYNGFCGYALVSRDGLLLQGNPHIGVLRHKEKLYVFSSKEAALEFASRSDDFIAEVAKKAKCSPELLLVLKLHQQDFCISHLSETAWSHLTSQHTWYVLSNQLWLNCESSTQTDIHPVETGKVMSYEWNEWELQRKAIKMTDLCNKVTHSAQTDLSHLRWEHSTQTWLPKNAATQSRREARSNVPASHIYLAGQRGQRNSPVENLSR
uniref:Cilia- and flagella-associated protein 206 n=1 Tax=Mola mola TaxID=94237 RepID=A0A3Q4BJ32_MOLML